MHFELSEKEFHGLESCQQQIGFMSDLCMHIEGAQSVSIVGLMHFLDAQKAALAAVIKSADERQTEQMRLNSEMRNAETYEPQRGLHVASDLLVRIMDVCSGATVSDEMVVKLYDELFDATVPQGQGEPLKALHAALKRLGYEVNYSLNEGVTQFTIKQPVTTKARSQTNKKPLMPARKRAKERLEATV